MPNSWDSISKYIIVRRGDDLKGFYDFIVNKDRLRKCLMYLKQNNLYYKDIPINWDVVDQISDGSVLEYILNAQEQILQNDTEFSKEYERLQHVTEEVTEEENSESNVNEIEKEWTSSFVPQLINLENNQQVEEILTTGIEESKIDCIALGINDYRTRRIFNDHKKMQGNLNDVGY